MKVAIIGCRQCEGMTIYHVLNEIPLNCTQIISGGARGIDNLAQECADLIHVELQVIEPQYACYGKAAPILRNVQIIEQADMVLAFWDFASAGTRSAIMECGKHGIPCKIIDIRPYMKPCDKMLPKIEIDL